MNPSTLRALAAVVRTISRNDGKFSFGQMLSHRRSIRRADVLRAWDLLLRLKILERPNGRENQDYRLVGLKEGMLADFLTIWMRKNVRVSLAGHRSVHVAAQAMALHDGVRGRVCGSLFWKEKIHMPKYRLPPVRVCDILHSKHVYNKFRVEEMEPTHMEFRLDFNPPLSAGNVVEYGFYVWNRSYYALSRKEALHLYKDEWIREGMAITGPTIDLRTVVRLPESYRYQACRLEKGAAPGFPGEVLPGLQHDEKTLSVSIQQPTPGNYYVCWIPPHSQSLVNVRSVHDSQFGASGSIDFAREHAQEFARNQNQQIVDDAFRGVSIQKLQRTLSRYQKLLGTPDVSEGVVHEFLEKNLLLLVPTFKHFWKKGDLRKFNLPEADFLVKTSDDEYVFIELENPRDDLLTKEKRPNPSKPLRDAETQIRAYLSDVRNRIENFRSTFASDMSVENVDGLIVIGRSSRLTERSNLEFQKYCADKSYSIITFDEPFYRTEALIRNIRMRYEPSESLF